MSCHEFDAFVRGSRYSVHTFVLPTECGVLRTPYAFRIPIPLLNAKKLSEMVSVSSTARLFAKIRLPTKYGGTVYSALRTMQYSVRSTLRSTNDEAHEVRGILLTSVEGRGTTLNLPSSLDSPRSAKTCGFTAHGAGWGV